MEYYVYCTYNCNLNCSYCSAKKVVSHNNNVAKAFNNNVIDFINNDIFINKHITNTIVFFGGEPTLVPDTIQNIICLTNQYDIKYVMYTNGTKIDELPEKIISKLDCIFVSIDGDEMSHETHRGKDTYSLIINKLIKFKSKHKTKLIARITLDEGVSIFDSVMSLTNYFDSIHWQIVNKANFNNPAAFKHSYTEDIYRLTDYWLQKLQQNIVIDIMPFRSIARALIYEDNSPKSFRCGSGSNLVVIDLNGNIYQCDEFVGDKDKTIGTIGYGYTIDHKNHKEICTSCVNCRVSNVCLGRCRKCLEEYDANQISNYCEMTITLIDYITTKLPEIRTLISHSCYINEYLASEINYTEQIP